MTFQGFTPNNVVTRKLVAKTPAVAYCAIRIVSAALTNYAMRMQCAVIRPGHVVKVNTVVKASMKLGEL